MMTKHQKVTVDIGEGFTATTRKKIAKELIDVMVDKAEAGQGIYNGKRKSFPKYSASYAKSLDFKIAGKSKSQVNLTLSGDMLAAIELLEDKETKLIIGFEDGTEENARADGNIRGSTKGGKARPFLGVTQSELEEILNKYKG